MRFAFADVGRQQSGRHVGQRFSSGNVARDLTPQQNDHRSRSTGRVHQQPLDDGCSRLKLAQPNLLLRGPLDPHNIHLGQSNCLCAHTAPRSWQRHCGATLASCPTPWTSEALHEQAPAFRWRAATFWCKFATSWHGHRDLHSNM